MAYRTGDPSELELRERRTRLRREHDELQERADRLACDLAEASRGGIVGGIRNLLGGKTEDELARARLELGALEGEIATLVQLEREIGAQLAQSEAKRTDLAAQQAARVEAARSAPGPLGEQLRAIAAERALVIGSLVAFDTVLESARRASTVVDELSGIESDLATSPATTAIKSMLNAAAVLTGGDVHTGDREATESRRTSHVELACTMIQTLLEEVPRLAHAWSEPKPLELAMRQLASLTTHAFDVASARTCIERLERTLISDRARVALALAQLDVREHDLVRNA